MIINIRLPNGEWTFDDSLPLGPAGGFGEVFKGHGGGSDVAIKRLRVTAAQAAHRELDIGLKLSTRYLEHVVPVLDAGQDALSDRYFLVMPICQHNLQNAIEESPDGISIDLGVAAIRSVVSGLQEVSDITHRDLKPANILFHNGVWKIADFGIAKFVEDSTSFETLRGALTPSYAAPEQWEKLRATSATDVYALGCIAHALFTGSPPFRGSIDLIREGHLHKSPPSIEKLTPRIAIFVAQMLRKVPAARPTLKRCAEVFQLEHWRKDESRSRSNLLIASQKIVASQATAEAKRLEIEAQEQERKNLIAEATSSVDGICRRLIEAVCETTELAEVRDGALVLGDAQLSRVEVARWRRWNASNEEYVTVGNRRVRTYGAHREPQKPNWDIVAWTGLAVTTRNSGNQPYRWSATLLFADRKNGDGYRWYEIAFWITPEARRFERQPGRNNPFGLAGEDLDLAKAVSGDSVNLKLAYGPVAIDGEDEEKFQNRWIELLSKGAVRDLKQPQTFDVLPSFLIL